MSIFSVYFYSFRECLFEVETKCMNVYWLSGKVEYSYCYIILTEARVLFVLGPTAKKLPVVGFEPSLPDILPYSTFLLGVMFKPSATGKGAVSTWMRKSLTTRWIEGNKHVDKYPEKHTYSTQCHLLKMISWERFCE